MFDNLKALSYDIDSNDVLLMCKDVPVMAINFDLGKWRFYNV